MLQRERFKFMLHSYLQHNFAHGRRALKQIAKNELK